MQRIALILIALIWLAGVSWPPAIAQASSSGAEQPPRICTEGNTALVPVPGPPVTVSLTPMSAPIVIPAEGGIYQYNVMVVNHSDTVQSFDLQTVIEGPGVRGTLEPVFITLQPGQSTKQVVAHQVVPAAAPAGSYVHTVSLVATCAGAGHCASAEPCTASVMHSAGFRWEKEAQPGTTEFVN